MVISKYLKSLTILAITFSLTGIAMAQPAKDKSVANKPVSPAVTTAAAQTAPGPVTPKKKSLVVLDFNDSSLIMGPTQRPIGKQIAILLTTEFARRGGFTVISQRDKELAEERIKTSGLGRDGNYAAKIGRELSANLVVFGDVIEYTVTTETKNQYVKKETKHEAKVGFTLTLVDVSTNEVRDGVTVEHISSSKDSDYGVINNSKALTEDQKITMLTDAAKQGVTKAVNELVKLIDPATLTPAPTIVAAPGSAPSGSGGASSAQNSAGGGEEKKEKKGFFGKMGLGGSGKKDDKKSVDSAPAQSATSGGNSTAAAPVGATGPRIAAIDGQTVFVRNLPAGTKVGAKIVIYRIGKKTIDKATGEVLFQEENTVGELEVIQVTDKAFICKLVSGTNITEDDLIKLVK